MKNRLNLMAIVMLLNTYAFANGEDMFDESFVHEIRITFEEDNFWEILEDNYEASTIEPVGTPKVYMLANVSIDGTVIDSVGVRQKGFYSNWGSDGLKEPMKIDFNEFVSGQKFDGLKKLNLQNGFSDPTFMRDALAYKLIRDAGGLAPRTSYVKLFLNDTYWGLFIAVEQVDEKFLKDRFENEDGNLFKCINNTQFKWQGSSPFAYQDEFGLKTNKELDDWTNFIDLVDKINDDDTFEDSISTQLQMNTFLRVLAADVIMYNWDSYYDHGRNFYVYYDSKASAFQWIPWDYNLAFSSTATNIVVNAGFGADQRPLIKHVMDSDIYQEMYFNHLCVLNDNYFTLANLEGYINSTRDLIYEAVDADPNKFHSTDDFISSIETDFEYLEEWYGDFFTVEIPGLKPFITQRNSEVATQLDARGHSCTTLDVSDEVTSFTASHSIYPNPSATGLFNVAFGSTAESLAVYNMFGEQVLNANVQDMANYKLDLTSLAAGVYLVEITGTTKAQLRIVIQ